MCGVVVGGAVCGVVVGGAVVRGAVEGGGAVGGDVTGSVAGIVAGAFVGATTAPFDVVVVTVGTTAGALLDDWAALAIPTMSKTSTTGTAIFAHSGQARTLSNAEAFRVCTDCAVCTRGTVGMTAVCSAGVTGTASVGAANSGAYHLPSDANHQPGSSGCWSSGARGVPVTSPTRLRELVFRSNRAPRAQARYGKPAPGTSTSIVSIRPPRTLRTSLGT